MAFFTAFVHSEENCEPAPGGLGPVEVAWPEFPWATEGLTEGTQDYNDAYDEVLTTTFPTDTRSNLLPTGTTQSTTPTISAGSGVEMLVQLDTTVAAMPALTTPTAGEIASWGPDTVDFFVQVTGTVNSTSLAPSGFVSQAGIGLGPVTVTVTDQGDGLWRIRLENIADMDINAQSNGDGIIEENGDFSDVANSVGNFFQGLTASQRYYSRIVEFDIGGTTTNVSVGYISRFSFS